MTTDAIDTNILLRCLLGDVPKQRKLAANLLRAPNSTHYLSNQALFECIYVLEIVEEMSRAEIVGSLDLFFARYDHALEYDRNLFTLASEAYRAHPKLSWADCALAAEAELKHREPLFTFDQKLARQLPQAKLLD